MTITPNIISLKQKLIKGSITGLALDIDETLSGTAGHWIEEMKKEFGNPENLSTKELIKRYRYAQNVPHWQTEAGQTWIEEARYSNKLQDELPLIENADLTVQEINKIIPIVAYITTRPELTLESTYRWLQKHHFPAADVISRPMNVDAADGSEWKAKVLEYLYPEILGIIDDNVGIVDFLKENYQGTIYLYDNADHPKKGTRIIPCLNWQEVLTEVQENYR